jgi:hypothetical protein
MEAVQQGPPRGGTELPSSSDLEELCVKFILTLPASELE